MSRPVDCLIDPVTKLCIPSSPHDVVYSGWVGDDDATFNGLRGCMRKVIYSAWVGYANFACDVGGYRGDTETKDQTNFLRSAQLNSFLPFMENGGGGEHRPWMYDNADDVVVPIYRKFVVQHHRLSAYLLTNGADAMDGGRSSIYPLDDESVEPVEYMKQTSESVRTHNDSATGKNYGTDITIIFPQPSTYAYLLGGDLLVHPVLYDAVNGTEAALVEIEFPQQSDLVKPPAAAAADVAVDTTPTVWMDWWDPANTKHFHTAGEKISRIVPLDTYPVYVRRGALMPLHPLVLPSAAAAARRDSADDEAVDVDLNRVIFTWFGPTASLTPEASYAMRESVTQGEGITATMRFTDDSTIVAEVSAHAVAATMETADLDASAGTRSVGGGISVQGILQPADVRIEAWQDGDAAAACDEPTYDSARMQLTVSCANLAGGLRVTLTGVTSAFA